jgi:hypothetical protein
MMNKINSSEEIYGSNGGDPDTTDLTYSLDRDSLSIKLARDYQKPLWWWYPSFEGELVRQ